MALRKHASSEPLREVVEREHPRDQQGLAAQLRTGTPEQRRWAARDLAAWPAAAPVLGERLLAEQDARVREVLFTSLGAIGGAVAVDALLPLLRSEDAQLRNGAIETLGSLGEAVGPRVAALLRDADPDVRIFTVNLLAELRHPQVVAWLLQVLRDDAAVNVVAAAIDVMAEVGGPDQVEPLRAAARRFADAPFVAFAADIACERMVAP